jgi:hypothetical protein
MRLDQLWKFLVGRRAESIEAVLDSMQVLLEDGVVPIHGLQ